ncbi:MULTISPECIES: hypothetical protein [Flavobacterium]|uniref:hypothetical protein n=1 Tax=Flavobacterium TaxID=237 RepID=UPI001FCCB580|nr:MULTISPECIES: hypothetical protein [Flavobacterium]UOK43840.1 hypothetical protein LZF87_06890 [Flavobacterium enshiense]
MKKIISLSVSVFLLVISLACSDDDDNSSSPSNNNQTIEEIKKEVMSGTWRITYFFDTDSDETSNFNGYNFTFGSNSILTATNGGNTNVGAWSVTDSNSGDDSPDDIDFNIVFAGPPDFAELSEDWHILEHTDTKLRLTHVSGGNGGTDYLTFEKN